MLLFIKGLLVGLAKIIPGVSGAMLLVNFNIYEKLILAITDFFSDWKSNLKYLFLFGSGLLIAIVIGSGMVLYLLTNYKFITMMFFVGLIIGGTYSFSRKVTLNKKSILIVIMVTLIFNLPFFLNFVGDYVLKNNIGDCLVLFTGGMVEVFASIVPGISGTSLLMMMGIYNVLLNIVTNSLNISYVVDNFYLYISFFLGMFFSFLINISLISFLFRKYHHITYVGILGLSISSIISLLLMILKLKITIVEFVLGIMVLMIGLLVSTIMNK